VSQQAPDRQGEALLALADRLFEDFDDLPVMTVIRTLNESRRAVGDDPLGLHAVEALARRRLRTTRRPHEWIRPLATWLGALAVGLAVTLSGWGIDPVAA
jgi:hypothetical protein